VSEKKEFAPGILDRNRFESLPSLAKPAVWKAQVSQHDAFKAGRHFDVRLLEPDSDNLHSWAIRRLPRPGEKVLAVLQPTHSASYYGWEGVIPSGYGAGAVHAGKSKARILTSEPGKISFQMRGQLFTLVRTGEEAERKWLLLNRTSTKLAMGAGGGAGPGTDATIGMAMAGKLPPSKFQKTVRELEKKNAR